MIYEKSTVYVYIMCFQETSGNHHEPSTTQVAGDPNLLPPRIPLGRWWQRHCALLWFGGYGRGAKTALPVRLVALEQSPVDFGCGLLPTESHWANCGFLSEKLLLPGWKQWPKSWVWKLIRAVPASCTPRGSVIILWHHLNQPIVVCVPCKLAVLDIQNIPKLLADDEWFSALAASKHGDRSVYPLVCTSPDGCGMDCDGLCVSSLASWTYLQDDHHLVYITVALAVVYRNGIWAKP